LPGSALAPAPPCPGQENQWHIRDQASFRCLRCTRSSEINFTIEQGRLVAGTHPSNASTHQAHRLARDRPLLPCAVAVAPFKLAPALSQRSPRLLPAAPTSIVASRFIRVLLQAPTRWPQAGEERSRPGALPSRLRSKAGGCWLSVTSAFQWRWCSSYWASAAWRCC